MRGRRSGPRYVWPLTVARPHWARPIVLWVLNDDNHRSSPKEAFGSARCRQRPGKGLARRLEQVRDPDGQAAEPLAGGVVDRVGGGGRHADRRDLAEALDAERIQQRVGLVDEVDLDLADVGVDR